MIGKLITGKITSKREVDFVIKEGLRVKQLIQVTYASAREIEQRELSLCLYGLKKNLKTFNNI